MSLFDRKTYVVKERVGLMKLVSTYDLLDAQSGEAIGVAVEDPPGLVRYLRLFMNNAWLPTEVKVYEREGYPPVLTIHRAVAILRPKVLVRTGGRTIGYFRAKLLTIGPSFRIFDANDNEIGLVKGDWKGWNFQLLSPAGQELGRVTKKWAGLAQEIFTTADTYVIDLSPAATGRKDIAQLMLAAGLAIDTVYKEKDE